MENKFHESVLVREVTESLHIQKNRKYIDATAGNGGHMAAIIDAGGSVLGIDLDPKMIEIAGKRLESYKNFKLVNGNFTSIDNIAEKYSWTPVSGILFDLGVTNIHLKDLERGFSFENTEAQLDMRIDPITQGVRASDLLNALREDQLINLFGVTLEPGAARWITGRVLHSRIIKPISTVGDMLEICEGLKTGKTKVRAETLPFLALRIAVNGELDNLRVALPKAYGLLEKGGRLVVISFHSGEDSIVKDFMNSKKAEGSKLITFRPITAGETELEVNRRARSAKMRVLEK